MKRLLAIIDWLMLAGACLAGIALLSLTGCEDDQRRSVPPVPGSPDGPCPPDAGGLSAVLDGVAAVATWGAGLVILAAPLAAIFLPFLRPLLGRIVLAAAGTLIAAQILVWVGAHLWWVSLGVLGLTLLCFGYLAWRHRRMLEPIIGHDLDGDDAIGEPITTKEIP